jgi:hypothetical protein
MRKIGEYLGLLEDTGRYPDDEGYEEYPDEQSTRPTVAESRPAPVARLDERRRTPAPQREVVAELSRITTLHPRTYNEARVIGENFRDGVPVIMNLSEMSTSPRAWSSPLAAPSNASPTRCSCSRRPTSPWRPRTSSGSPRVASSTRADGSWKSSA